MFNSMLLSFGLFAENVLAPALVIALVIAGLLTAMGGGWWGNSSRVRGT